MDNTDTTEGSNRQRAASGGVAGTALLASVFLAGLVLWGCSNKAATEEAPTVTVQVGSAENEAIARKVNADATLYPLDQAAIIPKITSPVRKFYVERGS